MCFQVLIVWFPFRIQIYGSDYTENDFVSGFYHEQSRPDRDDFLKIHLENVPLEKAHNFNKYPSYIIDSLGTKYDYHSVMHYNKNAFSKNKKMTMEPRDPYFTDLIGTGKFFNHFCEDEITFQVIWNYFFQYYLCNTVDSLYLELARDQRICSR